MVHVLAKKADLTSQLHYRHSNREKLKIDLAFIDADKKNYPLYYDLLIEKMNPEGLIIADNVLWSGKVIETICWSKD